MRKLVILFLLFICTTLESSPLKVGWYFHEPFQFHELGSKENLKGLDIDIANAVLPSQEITYVEASWDEQIKRLKNGDLDIVIGAFDTKTRRTFAQFSEPYRFEFNSIFYNSSLGSLSGDPSDIYKFIKKNRFRIGVIPEFLYVSDELNSFIEENKDQSFIEWIKDDFHGLQLLQHGEIKFYFANRTSFNRLIWENKLQGEISEIPMKKKKALHFMFSKKVGKDVLELTNEKIKIFSSQNKYKDLSNRYILPVYLNQIVNSAWFFNFDFLGTIAFALAGLLIAYREKYDISGAFILTILPAVGGGLIRDILTQNLPINIIRNPIYLKAIFIILAGSFLLNKVADVEWILNSISLKLKLNIRRFLKINIHIFDALGLAAFTITGSVIAIVKNIQPLWLWCPLLAALSGAGGGIVRDMVRAEKEISSIRGELYPEIAFLGGFLLSIIFIFLPIEISPTSILWCVNICFVFVFILRISSIYFNLRSPILSVRNES